MVDNKLKKFRKTLKQFENNFKQIIPEIRFVNVVIQSYFANGKIEYVIAGFGDTPVLYKYFGDMSHLMEILSEPVDTTFLPLDVRARYIDQRPPAHPLAPVGRLL